MSFEEELVIPSSTSALKEFDVTGEVNVDESEFEDVDAVPDDKDVDLVLVFPTPQKEGEDALEHLKKSLAESPAEKFSRQSKEIHSTDDEGEYSKSTLKKMKVRKNFEDYLSDQQELELKRVLSQDGKLTYVLIKCPFERLCHEAELLAIQCELKVPKEQEIKLETHKVGKKWIWFHKMTTWYKSGISNEKNFFLSADFKLEKSHLFKHFENRRDFFTKAQRIEMVYHILANARFLPNSDKIGIDLLIAEGYYETRYALHDGPFQALYCTEDELDNNRRTLAKQWTRWSFMFKMQPLELIRSYFGEEIAFYFQFMTTYTIWLVSISLFGFIILIFGIIRAFTSVVTDEICDSTYVLCAQSQSQEQYPLKDTCSSSRMTTVFDNELTIAYAIVATFWGALFVRYWYRKMHVKSFKWNVWDIVEDENPRPQYLIRKRKERKLKIQAAKYKAMTKAEKKTVSKNFIIKRHLLKFGSRARIVIGRSSLLFMLCLLGIITFGIVVYRIIIGALLYSNSEVHDYSSAITAVTAGLINLVVIILLEYFYNSLAVSVTDWENHRTETEYQNSLVNKVIAFNAANTYASLFYIAFFKGRFSGSALKPNTLFGFTIETCTPAGCMNELTIQLLIIMAGKNAYGNILELGLPWLKQKIKKVFHSRVNEVDLKSLPQWEQDYLLNEYPGHTAEYQEMILQFGFVVLFAAASPIAPFLALINNFIEIRSDGRKFLQTFRRPITLRSQNIGSWSNIMVLMVKFGIITNAFILALSSDFLIRLKYFSLNQTMHGYIDFIFSFSPPSTTIDAKFQDCYYRGFYDDSGNYLQMHFEIIIIFLAFVIVYEHVMYVLVETVFVLIPKIPEWIKKIIVKQSEVRVLLMGRSKYYDEADEVDEQEYGIETPATEDDNLF